MHRIQDIALTWVIGDYTMYVTHFEGDEDYVWTVGCAPVGYKLSGKSNDMNVAIQRMLDIAESHQGGTYIGKYHFDFPGPDVIIEATPQTPTKDVIHQAIEKSGYDLNTDYNWQFTTEHGLWVEMDLPIGTYTNITIHAHTNGIAV